MLMICILTIFLSVIPTNIRNRVAKKNKRTQSYSIRQSILLRHSSRAKNYYKRHSLNIRELNIWFVISEIDYYKF
jgi:hypothetical protein